MSSQCFIIAIAGGSGSGKTTLARHLHEALASRGCAMLGQDSYYIDQSSRFDRDGGVVNFDHPNALEFSLMARHLEHLRRGQAVEIPTYEFSSHKRLAKTTVLEPQPFLLVDGTLILSRPELLPHFDESVFLTVREELRFQRRLHRDVHERGRTPEGVRDQFMKQVKPMHDQFVEPSSANCTILVSDNSVVHSRRAKSHMHDELMDVLRGSVEKA